MQATQMEYRRKMHTKICQLFFAYCCLFSGIFWSCYIQNSLFYLSVASRVLFVWEGRHAGVRCYIEHSLFYLLAASRVLFVWEGRRAGPDVTLKTTFFIFQLPPEFYSCGKDAVPGPDVPIRCKNHIIVFIESKSYRPHR